LATLLVALLVALGAVALVLTLVVTALHALLARHVGRRGGGTVALQSRLRPASLRTLDGGNELALAHLGGAGNSEVTGDLLQLRQELARQSAAPPLRRTA
jgi:hypothetical protein